MAWVWACLLTGAAAAAALPPGANAVAQDTVALRSVRFYRGDRTLVHGFLDIPIAGHAAGHAVLQIVVSVRDTGGTVLWRDAWTREVEGRTGQSGLTSVEGLAVTLAAGTYYLDAVVTDSATGRSLSGGLTIGAYATRPRVSDLLLASLIRTSEGADTAALPGELRKGALLITTAPRVTLRPSKAVLFFYSEVYHDSAQSVPWRLQVRDTTGRVLVSTAAVVAEVSAGGGVITGSVDLTGLPSGDYVLTQVVGAAADTVSTEAGFAMGGFDLDRRVAEAERLTTPPGDMPAPVADADLDGLIGPLVYLAPSREQVGYRELSAEGKQRYLREFWASRDPTPGTAQNEARDAFYARVAVANRRFAEGGRGGAAGWRTDRGRIFIMYGEPNEVLRRPQAGFTLPWEAWKYLADRPRKYVFMDETRLGNYVLIFSDDIKERSYPNWDSILGDEAAQEIRRF